MTPSPTHGFGPHPVRTQAAGARRALGAVGLALLLTLLGGGRAAAQSGDAFLIVNPQVFGPYESIHLWANFGADMSPDYYYLVGWWAGLRITGDNFYATEWETDDWLDECYWYWGSSCEGSQGEPYYDPWLLQTGWDDGPGQTMTETGYMAEGLAVFLEAICTEGYCWEVEWWVPAGYWEVAVPQEPPPPPPVLTLFLDAIGNFNQNAPLDHSGTYLPGTVHGTNNQATHVSVPVQPEGQPLWPTGGSVRLIAAFVNDQGVIVAPPGGVTSVTFRLQNTSAFVGYAMNAGTSTEPDFALLSGGQKTDQLQVNFSGNLAIVDLGVFDYGGFTTARVEVAGYDSPSFRIPRDGTNGPSNWIPDAGWRTWSGVHIEDTGAANFVSDDSDPGPATPRSPGDGLTAYQEYRGFMVRNVHRRTNPYFKDLFIDSVLTDTINIGYAINLPLTKHWVFPEQLIDVSPNEWIVNLINANYVNHGFGGNMPGHYNQRGIRVRVGDYLVENNFGQVPDDCPPADWFVLDPEEDCNPNWQPETMEPQPVRPVLIRLEAIREKTPPNFDRTTDGDPADEAFIRLVTAHEIGHMLSMPEWPYGGSGETSVMIDGGSFLQHFGPNFENVPTNYLPRDVEYLMLFCGTNEARIPCVSAL